MAEIPDALLEKTAQVVERELGSYCDPQNPAKFWPYIARAVLAAVCVHGIGREVGEGR